MHRTRFSDRMLPEVVHTFWAALQRGEFITDAAVQAGEHTSAELAELFGVARSTVYRAIDRAAKAASESGIAGTVPA